MFAGLLLSLMILHLPSLIVVEKTAPANPAYSAGICEVCGVFTADSAGLISDVTHEYCSRKLRKFRVRGLR